MEVVKNNFIVITGGPGGGKTTLLNALSERGLVYIEETARSIIRERLGKGLSPRPAPAEFARQIFQLDVENYLKNRDSGDVTFFDRSFLDSAAMIYQSDKAYFEDVKEVIKTHRFNTKVFITPPWEEIYQNDSERDQSFEEAVNVYELLYDWYSTNGYKLVVLPKTAVEKRVEFILGELSM